MEEKLQLSETLLHVSFSECVSTSGSKKEGFFRLTNLYQC